VSELTLFKGGVPDFMKNVGADDVTNALAGGAQRGSRRISIKGGVFREFIGGREHRVSEERSMNVVIIKAAPNVSRTYYKGTYAEGEAVRPECWSSDSQRPDPSVKNKQCDSCLKCPQNIKGSAPNDGRACRFSQRLAVVIEGEIDKREVYQLVLPATSIFGEGVKGKLPLRAYAEFLQRENAPMSGVVTEMKFDTSSPTPKLVFRPIRVVTEEEWEVIQELKDSDDAKKAIELTVAQTDGVTKDAPKSGFAKAALPAPVEEDEEEEAPKPKPKAKPAPVEDDEEDEVEEPKKAAPKKSAPTAEPSKSLEDLVGEWDD